MIRALNALLKHADVALVRASRLGFQYELVTQDEWVPSLPGAADAALLRGDNKRLLALREQYAGLGDHPARVASLWSAEFSSTVDLTTFRGHNAYLWQIAMTPAQRMSFLLAGYYAHSVDALGLLERMTEDGAFGAYTFRFMERFTGSRDLVDSVGEINFLERHLGLSRRSGFSVLDIGAGYGRLLHRLAQAFPQSMRGVATDAVPESTFLSEFYLRHRGVAGQVQVVPLPEVEATLSGQAIDLVTNVHSFSECTLGAIEWWLDRVVQAGARHLFIVPNAYHNGGLQLLSRERDGRYLDFLPAIERRGFRLLAREPKYRDTSLHAFGINTYYHLFERG
jgi:SAM-dependent methyltransferase